MKQWNKLLNLIYPSVCPLCTEVLSDKQALVCAQCKPLLAYPQTPVCLKCGCEIADSEQELCEDCGRRSRSYVRGFPAMKYEYPLDESLARFKYHNQRGYADFYANEIIKRYGKLFLELGIEALIPVPVHKKKRQVRGYNQAEVLAEAIGRRLGILVECELLERIENTAPQKTLDPEHREENLKRAFQCTKKQVSYKKVLLVDDIYTTGATVEACTKSLHAAQISEVYYTSVAIGIGNM